MTTPDPEDIVRQAEAMLAASQETQGVVLLDEVRTFISRFVAFPSPEALDAVALWTVHAHLIGAFESSPRLALLSPEPGSGKTRTLEVLELLVPLPMSSLSASTPAIFRSLAQAQRTLLFDEVDAVFGRHGKEDPAEDLRALLNAGHRRGATIPRCVGPTHDVSEFPVFSAVALAGLGDLPDTLMSRSIVVRMRRRLPTERIEPFRRRLHAPQGEDLRGRLAEWSGSPDVFKPVRDAWPEMPANVVDRPADVWEPLLAVADVAGGHWPDTARAACTALVKVAANREASLGVKLLSDLRTVFAAAESDRLSTETVLERLHALEESPWGDLRGKPLDARGLARRLAPYDVHSTQFKMGSEKVRGYSIPGSDTAGGGLYDAFTRYLPSGPDLSGTDGTEGTPQVSTLDQVPDNDSGTGTEIPSGTKREPLTRDVPAVPDVPLFSGSASATPQQDEDDERPW